jgi:peptide/nickel transport system permease protein
MGLLLFEATLARDYPLLQAGMIITTGIFVAGTLIADFTYSLVDPRVDLRGMEE